jgi:hypothetical protein
MKKQYITTLLLPVALAFGSTQFVSAGPTQKIIIPDLFKSVTVPKGSITGPSPAALKQTKCNAYADKAIAQHNENIKNKCGLSGWFSNNRNAHLNWCLQGNNINQIDKHTQGRDNALKRCKNNKSLKVADSVLGKVNPKHAGPATKDKIVGPNGPKVAVYKDRMCADYATAAVKQSKQAAKLKCGFWGSTWNSSHKVHEDWCLAGNNFNKIEQKTADRNKQLKHCGKKAKKEDRGNLKYAIGGFLLGFLADNVFNGSNNNQSYGNQGQGGDHTGWCYNRYKSYRASDNTYQPYNGPRRQCNSPYN